MSPDGAQGDALDLYQSAPCGLISTSMDGTILTANETFLDWTGYGRDELVGRKKLSDLLTAGGRIYHETHYAPLIRMQGSAREIALELVAADERRLPALINAVVRTNAAGDAQDIRLAVFPASDRRSYENELVRARRVAEEAEARARGLAETLQASFIPPTPPAIPTLDVGAAFRPAGAGDEVGGDFYDVFQVGTAEWAVVVGDVRGKGAQAAAVTALARYTIRAAAPQVHHPREVLGMLNEAMLRQEVDTFCTVAYARVSLRDPEQVEVTIAAGGHPLPIHVTAAGLSSAVGKPGMLMGVFPEPDLHDRTVTLGPGDLLTIFTDGVTEGRRGGELFGETRLAEVLEDGRASDASAVAARVVDDVVRFQDHLPKDDIAVVVLKVPAAAAPG